MPETALSNMQQIGRARELFHATLEHRFNEVPFLDIQDRLGLLTVVIALRQVAGFGFAEKNNEGNLRKLREILINRGLFTQITRQIQCRSHRLPGHIPERIAEVFDRVDADDYWLNTGRLLWVFDGPGIRQEVKKAVKGERDVGTLLGYPACCVERDRLRNLRGMAAFDEAIIRAVGEDLGAIENALRNDLKVEMPDSALNDPNISRTTERLPFVFHIACDDCLSSEASPSAQLNRSYQALAQDVQLALHQLIKEMAALELKIHEIVDEAEQAGVEPGQLDAATNEHLEGLFRERDEIYKRFFRSQPTR